MSRIFVRVLLLVILVAAGIGCQAPQSAQPIVIKAPDGHCFVTQGKEDGKNTWRLQPSFVLGIDSCGRMIDAATGRFVEPIITVPSDAVVLQIEADGSVEVKEPMYSECTCIGMIWGPWVNGELMGKRFSSLEEAWSALGARKELPPHIEPIEAIIEPPHELDNRILRQRPPGKVNHEVIPTR